ncbi:hypothetical protein MRQ36_28020 [Micromonospora sp. R77]|uniref:hypothetical protein n=1 Tax=Micromonospora sp. R77 TaxID=2925836 RepID=UPI001F605AEE|nr:hypothetical protein [Micromonospora sp. R77]MCI4066189.1 hypothetical protein [Micromonospora sp. R77]
MIVCLSDDVPQEALAGPRLATHLGVPCVLTARFWAVPGLRRWQRHHLIGLRKGRPAACAGGPIGLLDLHGMRHAAAAGAAIRHQIWQHAVHGTRPATSWPTLEARHLANPDRYSRDAAIADFHAQPRINAMRLHAVTNPGPGQPTVAEVEMYQAGALAYQHYSAATAVVGDAMITADGRTLAPASDALTDRTSYLEQALRYLDTLAPDQRLLAVTL